MGAKTQYYEYNLPANDDYADQNKFNENFESLDTTLHNMQTQIDSAAAGLKYKGAVNYYSNLPNNAEEGDAYTVLYAGSSGSVADGTEYVWGKVNSTLQWIDFSKDSYTKAEVNGLLAAKQATLTAGTGLSFGTGSAAATLGHSNSTTAQSTQAFRQVAYDAQGHITGSTAATTAQAAAINSGITSTDVAQINTNKSNILLNLQANGAINNMIPTLVDKSTYGTYNTTAHTFAEETGHLDTTRNTLQWQVAVGSGTSLSNAVQIAQVVNKSITTPQTNAWSFTKTAEMTKIWFGHGAASGGVSTTFMFDISNLSDGVTYWIITTFDNVVHADVDPQPYVWRNVMIVDDSIFTEVYRNIAYSPYTMTNAEITAWILSQS